MNISSLAKAPTLTRMSHSYEIVNFIDEGLA